LLPVSEIEPAFAPLVSVGREVSTVSGSIDNLFLSTQGYLTIAETKLWRNPEARREVVGQLVDYAKDVSQWSFSDLESKVSNYNARRHQKPEGVLASLRRLEDIDETQEQIITDTITRNLRNGRFLLLVVGDGIRESVEAMADYLQQTPQLHFTLALVELQVYEIAGEARKPLLVIPQVVARTREVTRAVVRVEGKAIESVQVGIDTEPVADAKQQKRFTLTEDDYFAVLKQSVSSDDFEFATQLKKDMEERGCIIEWRQASFVATLPDPGGSGQKLSLLVVYKNGQVQLSELASQLRSVGLPEQIAHDYTKESAQLFSGCQVSTKSPGYWSRPVTLGEIRQQYQRFVSVVQKGIDRIREAAKKQTSS
jgi:hypothetical protein